MKRENLANDLVEVHDIERMKGKSLLGIYFTCDHGRLAFLFVRHFLINVEYQLFG